MSIFLNLISVDYNLFVKMITLDSLLNAIYFIKIFINNNLSESQIVTEIGSIYTGTSLDRYIYYFLSYLFYKTVCTLLWVSDISMLYFMIIMTILPPILNIILTHKIFLKIKEAKEMIVRIIIAKIFTKIIKFYSKLYLEREIKINYEEILILLKDYNETLNHFYSVLKNTLLILLLSYVKNYSSKTYYKLIKYVYNYKTGELINSYNDNNAKYYLIDILDNKKWDAFTKPNTYKAIIQLYQMNIDNTDLFRKIIMDFNYLLGKMFAIWTIASLLDNIYLIPILSFIMLIYRRIAGKLDNYKLVIKIIAIVISAIIGYFYNSFFVISILCHFGSYVLFNKITGVVSKMIIKNTDNFKNYLVYENHNITLSYFSIVLYMCIFKYNVISSCLNNSFLILLLSIVMNIIINTNIRKQLIFGLVLCITYISHFDLLHILYTTLIMILIIHYIDFTVEYQNTIKDISINTLKILKYVHEKYMGFKDKIREMAMLYKDDNIKNINQQNVGNSIIISSSLKESVSLDDDIFKKTENEFIKEISVEDEIRQGKHGEYLVRHVNPKINVVENFFE
ncbi:hypothetical protein Klosneuvirus_1_290 [Klosneuvirus KNV1]|uniref:Uncharacterized protein n=1 Tax=Klosneuvirus KNV1 TaxID=1977640 RepID=A0A1V0SI82_9VIRU|nr:hypothetical protein Klosneuvirus_1_290 [Klosneuvirus KNV1]